MPRVSLAVVTGLLLASAHGSQERLVPKPASDGPATPAARQYREFLRQYHVGAEVWRAEEEHLLQTAREARTEQERRKAQGDYRKAEKRDLERRSEYARRFLELAQKYPNDPSAVDALVQVALVGPPGPEVETALGLLAGEHVRSGKLGPALWRWPCEKREKELLVIAERNPHRGVRGRALWELARHLKYEAARGRPESARERKEREGLLERVVERYADLQDGPGGRTLGDLARADLFEARELAVGKVAPEIDGRDGDGRRFRLSDYRGKVVVLDFWASG